MKKLISVLLIFVFISGFVPLSIFAEESLPDQDGLIDFLEYYNDSGRFPVEFDHTKPDFCNYSNDRNKTLYNAIMTSHLGVHYSKYPGNESLRTCFSSYSLKQESDENTQYVSWTADPRGLCNKNDNYMYYRYDADKVDWIAKNIFNCSENDCNYMKTLGETACSDSSAYYKFYCQDGYYYDITHYASGEEGYAVVTINSFEKKGNYYYIEYNECIQPYSSGSFAPINTTYYAKMQYKEIDGSSYWTLYAHSSTKENVFSQMEEEISTNEKEGTYFNTFWLFIGGFAVITIAVIVGVIIFVKKRSLKCSGKTKKTDVNQDASEIAECELKDHEADLPQKQCRVCGNFCRHDSKFCTKCGSRFNNTGL